MAKRTAPPVPSPVRRRFLALGVLGTSALIVGGFALRNEMREPPPRATVQDGIEWREVILGLRGAVIDARASVLELDAHGAALEADGPDTPRNQRGKGRRGDGARAAGNRAQGLVQSTAKRVASLADLPGIEKAVPGTDVAQIERSVTRMASQMAAGPLDGEALKQIRAGMAGQLATIEQALADSEKQAESDEDGIVDETQTGPSKSAIEDGALRRNVLAGAFAFVFLNFVLLFLQTIRSKPVPKVVQDTFQASASFLIGAGTSLWMS